MTYEPPIDQLLQLGDVRNFDAPPAYSEMGFEPEHIPSLIEMATDLELMQIDFEQPEPWGAVHAWRVLGMLEAEAAIVPLLNLFHELPGSYWTAAELPNVFIQIGESAITPIARYIADDSIPSFARARGVRSLRQLAQAFPDRQIEVIDILRTQLDQYQENDATLNGFLIRSLVVLQASSAADQIKRAYDSRQVNQRAAGGTWLDQQLALGLITAEEYQAQTPVNSSPEQQAKSIARALGTKQRNKAKSKRKQAKKSRKQNRKRS